MSDARDPAPRVLYRCCGCGFEFAPALPRAAPCPRCGSIGGHEEVGRAGGSAREAGTEGRHEVDAEGGHEVDAGGGFGADAGGSHGG